MRPCPRKRITPGGCGPAASPQTAMCNVHCLLRSPAAGHASLTCLRFRSEAWAHVRFSSSSTKAHGTWSKENLCLSGNRPNTWFHVSANVPGNVEARGNAKC
eukprot:3188849-Pyramimonas_sp.AAC.1